jgi:hypothetical protein
VPNSSENFLNQPDHAAVRNTKLGQIVESIVQKTELGNSSEIYMCIIAPLSQRNKLFKADCIIHHAKRNAAGYVASEEWENAYKVHIELLKTGLQFGMQSEIGVKATVAVVEFLSLINTKAAQSRIDGHGGDEGGRYRSFMDLKENLLKELKQAEESVVCELLAFCNESTLRDLSPRLSHQENTKIGKPSPNPKKSLATK